MSSMGLVGVGVLILMCIPIVVIDLRERRIPNAWNLALAGAGLGMALVRAPHFETLGAAGLDLLQTLGLFLGLMVLMSRLGQAKGLGMGDVKFLAAASLWVGFGGALALFVLASLLAVVAAVARAPWGGLDLKTPRPFGPMLAASLVAVAVFADLLSRPPV